MRGKFKSSDCTAWQYTSGTVDSGNYQGEVAAALQNVRKCPSLIVGSPESIKFSKFRLQRVMLQCIISAIYRRGS